MLHSYRFAWKVAASVVAVAAVTGMVLAEETDRDLRLYGLAANFLSLAPFTPGQLLDIDPATGMTMPVGTGFMIEPKQIGLNLAADSRGGVFNLFSPVSLEEDATPKLHQLDPYTGAFVRSVPVDYGTDDPFHVYATAFDSRDRLYAVVLNSAPNVIAIPVLVEIDTETGRATFGPTAGTFAYTGLAFDTHDQLFGVAPGTGLVSLDAATGAMTILGGDLASVESAAGSPSIAFDPQGRLYAAADRLLTVDPATGAATAVSDHLFPSWTIVGMDFTRLPPASDFDLDGDSDGVDFLAWQHNFPIKDGSATLIQGDANRDGNVDGSDFLIWQREFFAPGDGTGGAAVPEPASLVLLAMLLAALIGRKAEASRCFWF